MLLSHELQSEAELSEWLNGQPMEARTPNSITTIPALWAELEATRDRGYAVDDQENEIGINCVAVLADLGTPQKGAVSLSALAFRLPLEKLIVEVPTIRSIITGARGLPAALTIAAGGRAFYRKPDGRHPPRCVSVFKHARAVSARQRLDHLQRSSVTAAPPLLAC
ncbi:IclR family transcriptional regulator domain-containing protein [Arthrobacter sp. SA17]